MATTYLTIGSRFQPYTLSEMLVPYQIYKDEYQRQEDLYNTYAETAGLIGADLNPALDLDILNNTYNPYMQALSSGAEALATEGLTPGGRKQLQELRRRFGREITPIKVASEARAKARENWDKMLAQDKTLMTNANPYYKGISAYMNGASPDTTYVSGNELYSRGQNLAEAFSKTMREVPEDERLALRGQYFRIVNQYGADSAEANAFMQGEIDRIPALAKQVDEILANSGIDAEGFTLADKERARQYIIEGMKAGLSGETKVDYLQNRQWGLPSEDPEYPENSALGAGTVDWGVHSDLNKRQERKLGERVENTSRLVETTYDGDTYYLSPELKSYAYFIEHPEEAEEYAEWRKEQWRKTLEEDSRLKQYSNGALDGMTESEILYYNSVKKRFDRTYPEIPSKEQLDKLIETEQKDNQIEEASKKYSYLSDNELQNIKLGTAYEQASHHIPKTTTPFASNNKSTAVSNFIDNIQRTPARMYEYDMESMSYKEKPLDVKKASEARQKVNSVSLDRDGRVILETTDGKFYYWEGTNIDKSTQKRIQSAVMALTDFSKEFSERTEPDGSIQLPGIGELEDRPRLSDEQLQEGTVIKDFNTLVKDGVIKPIISSGNVLWFKATVTNSEGLPVNILVNNNGMIVGKMSLDQVIRGGGTQAFWLIEDLKDLAIDEWLNAASKGTE